MRTPLAAAVLALFVATGLAACTPQAPAPAQPAAAAPQPTASASGMPVAAPEATPGAPDPSDGKLGGTQRYQLGTNAFGTVVDGGPRHGARGSTTTNPEGDLASYTVVADDSFEGIRDRFALDDYVLIDLNSVRRDNPFAVYVGDVINLDPTTITTVGSQNGAVAKNPIVEPHPPQR